MWSKKASPISNWNGKTMNCLGDSLTAGDVVGNGTMGTPWTSYITSLTGVATVRNYGQNGTKLSSTDASAFVNRYTSMNSQADIISVWGGTNDFCFGATLGVLGDTTNTTFYGSLDVLIRGLYGMYPNAEIFFVTPPKINKTGVAEVDTLTISASATATGNITITLNGVATNVAVALNDTVGSIGDKIRATAFTGWTTGGTAGSATVTFTKNTVGTNSSPVYSGGSTGATGSIVVTTSGVSFLGETYTPNSAGKVLKDYRDAMIAVCDKYSIPVLDIFSDSSMSCYLDNGTYRPDKLHFTVAGYQRISHKIASFMNSL